jgi:thiamine-phosphate pyrophosphorylase
VAIGGITLERAAEVVAAGASGIAVISDLLRDDPERRTRQFIDLVQV